ncbi:MAG: DUF4332 domain-containing protein, partial [Thermoplasmatota archaeon]
MELKHIKGVGPAKQEKLKAAGITDVTSLAHGDVADIAAKSGLSEAQVREYKQKAVALNLIADIKGMGPETVKSLAQSGVRSLQDLYEASAEYLAKQAKVAQEQAKAWQTEAKKLADHVATEAKTPEGRKKLAGEAKDVAQAAAKATQEKLVDLYHNAQKEGEAAIAKAKDLKEKAPAYVHEARDKAEKALKDAEQKVKDLQGKAPDVRAKAEKAVADAQAKVADLQAALKKEGEKIKAANEGLFARIKAKFS